MTASTLYLTQRFIYDPDFVTRIINWRTDSLFCHTEALSHDGTKWIGAHAGTGVDARPLDWCKPTRERVYRLPVTPTQYAKVMQFLESSVGRPYDYSDVFGLLLNQPALHNCHAVICSALQLTACLQADYFPLNVLPEYAYRVTPELLHASPVYCNRCTYVYEKDAA